MDVAAVDGVRDANASVAFGWFGMSADSCDGRDLLVGPVEVACTQEHGRVAGLCGFSDFGVFDAGWDFACEGAGCLAAGFVFGGCHRRDPLVPGQRADELMVEVEQENSRAAAFAGPRDDGAEHLAYGYLVQ